ncbi:MAG TPA: hypothetical protein VNL39_12975 [Xanthobacteraceae bacterium]|nr:hypothetical protein [Xanthobacteraceae bacterium]
MQAVLLRQPSQRRSSVSCRPRRNRFLPWCLKAVAEDCAVDLCYFRSFESCNRERFYYGPKSFCIVNPHYYFRDGEPDQAPHKPDKVQR